MDDQSDESMSPPPTYGVTIACLLGASLLIGAEVFSIVYRSRVEIFTLFVAPGAALLGLIGLFDPRIPASLQPGARGYPRHVRLIANACWIISVLVGSVLYFGVFRLGFPP
jgi:hypothetical protein